MLAVGVLGSRGVDDAVVGSQEAEEKGDESRQAEGGSKRGEEGVGLELS